jgi:hypothetical protein
MSDCFSEESFLYTNCRGSDMLEPTATVGLQGRVSQTVPKLARRPARAVIR